ncbi:MAG TPA: sigma-54-dependent Fis family transcriptional regulator, partial [Sedimenticola sp.]|nr:sigma-54-dependent Fis family transcriptional regulator [Sedimenticola sp.]
MAELLAEIASARGFNTVIAEDGATASAILERGDADVLLTDLRLPPPDGQALLRLARHLQPDMPTVLIPGHATLKVAVDSFRGGLFDLVTKPFDTTELEVLMDRLHRLLEHRAHTETLTAQVSLLEQDAFEPVTFSSASRKAQALIEQVAPLDVPVLLNGETGTGKTVSARMIHRISPWHDGPFFNLSCAAVAPDLAESELFGHEPGAFTGASARKRGLLELADGGTLLLDEINSAGQKIQARLLQFIQERTVLRVGGTRPVPVSVRLIFASNQPLEPLVEKGTFRQDLYFRINVFPVTLPSLRERREDIVPLAEKILLRFARELERPARQFTPAALDSLVAYTWPGNIRELENLVQRAVILAPDEKVDLAHLPLELRPDPGPATSAASPFPADATLAQVERIWIEQMLERCRGNKTQAAR